MTRTTSAPLALRDRDGMAVVGRTLADLRGHRFDREEGGATPPAPAAPAPAAPATPAVPGTPAAVPNPTGGVVRNTPAAAPADPGTPPAPGADPAATPGTPPAPAAGDLPAINPRTNLPYTPAETQAHITRLNEEARTQREAAAAATAAAAEANARTAAVLRAAGFNPDGTPYTEQTPEQVAAATAAKDAALATTARENLVLRIAPNLGADADKLLDSRAFNDKLSALNSDDRTGAEALVTEWIQKDPTYRVTSAAAASGGAQHTGTPGNTGQRMSKGDAIAAKYPSRK